MIDRAEPSPADDLQLIREQLRRFVEREITPHAHRWEIDRRVPAAVFERMGALGFLGLSVPEEYGGSGLDLASGIVLTEELARSSYAGVSGSISVHTSYTTPHLVRFGTDQQRARYLPDIVAGRRICALGITEPGASSDLNRLSTTARRDGDTWILNGRKTYITNANIADLFFVVARTDPSARGAKGFSMFLVERGFEGFSNGTVFDKTGWHSSDTGELVFDDCRVPADNLIGEEGRGFYQAIAGLEHERICLATEAAVFADIALTETLSWVRMRPAYGKTLWDLQAIRHEIARLRTELAAARCLLDATTAKATRGDAVQIEACMLKVLLPELVNRIAYKCVQFHGGAGFVKGSVIERVARDTRFFAIGGGSTEVMLDEIAKRL